MTPDAKRALNAEIPVVHSNPVNPEYGIDWVGVLHGGRA
jgi:hypothetical protein